MISSLFLANKGKDKTSHVVLVANSDNYFKTTTKVTSIVDADPSNPKIRVIGQRVLGNRGRYLLVRFQIQQPKTPIVKSTGDLETGAISITLQDPPITTSLGVGYIDD
jgi:hypothetical protein